MRGMSILGGLAAFGQGAQQGQQLVQAMQMRAQQIQQAQMQLDQEKQKLAAGVAMFQKAQQQPQFGQPGPGGGPQPPAPGQPSQPSTMQQGPMLSAAQPQARPAAPPMSPPSPGSGSPSPAPAGGSGPGAGATPNQQQIDPSQMDPNAMLDRMIDQVNQRYPNADPETKFSILQERLDLLGKIQPALRPVTQLLTTQMREEGQNQRTEEQVQGRADVAKGQEASREKVAAGNQQASLQRTQMQIQGAMERVQATQSSIDARQKAGQIDKGQAAAQKAVVGDLQTQLRTLSTRYNAILAQQPAGTDPATVPAAQALQKQIDAVTAKMERAEKLYGGSGKAPQAAPAAGSSGGFSATPVQ